MSAAGFAWFPGEAAPEGEHGAAGPSGGPQDPPGWGRGDGWKNVNDKLLEDPNGERWRWHPEDETHNKHWDHWDKRNRKTRLNEAGEDLGEEAFKEPEAVPAGDEAGEPKKESGGGDTAKRVAKAAGITLGGVGVGYGVWLVAKWGVAIFFAPETGGGSVILALETP